MVDSKKRPLEEYADGNVTKRRAISMGSDSPNIVDGHSELSPEDVNAANLETFRKQAIYRRMKFYFREHERAQEQIAELEKRRDLLQANFTMIVAYWEKLVREINLLVNPADLLGESKDFSLFEVVSEPKFARSSTYLNSLLQTHSAATEQLVSGVVSLNPKLDKGRLLNRCTDLEQEVVSLRAEIFATNSRMFEVNSEKDRYHSSLIDVEGRLDRMEITSFTAASNSHLLPVGTVENSPNIIKKEEEDGVTLPSAQSLKMEDIKMNGHVPSESHDDEDWKKRYELCSRSNEEIMEELIQLRSKCAELSFELTVPSQETLKRSAIFDNIVNQLQTAKNDAEFYREKCSDINSQLERLREIQEDFKEKTTADYNVKYEEQKNLIIKKEVEATRLREQRDSLQAEVSELRAKGNERKSASQFEILLQARADRIVALESEVKRLRSRIAADAGNEDLLELIINDKSNDLPATLRLTQRRLETLESSLSVLDTEHPDVARYVRSECEVKEELKDALSRLKRYESLYGSTSALPLDQQTLLKQLSQKEESLRKAELQLTQGKAASDELFTEIERLSAAWEALDRQIKSKVLNMDGMEVKLQKSSVEKAKADNKYFAAMRQKEAAEAECKAATRALEKLQKAVERFTEAEKSASAKLAHQEKEILAYQKRADSLNDKVVALDRLNSNLVRQDEDHVKAIAELKKHLADAHTREKKYKQSNRNLEEECIKLRRQVEQAESKIMSIPIASSPREAELEEQVEKCMKLLRCSTCKQNLRSHVLTKCMHTFCKDCVQARIDTRQRKCPACNMAFSQGEFQALYFQG